MAQTSILGRMGQLVRANINAILDSAEDPEKMLNQMVIDYTNNIREAEEAVAQTIGNLRLLEDDEKEAREASAEWGSKALAASRKADGYRAAGNASRRGQVRQPREDRAQAADRRWRNRSRPSTSRSRPRPSWSTSSRKASTACARSARSWSRRRTS